MCIRGGMHLNFEESMFEESFATKKSIDIIQSNIKILQAYWQMHLYPTVIWNPLLKTIENWYNSHILTSFFGLYFLLLSYARNNKPKSCKPCRIIFRSFKILDYWQQLGDQASIFWRGYGLSISISHCTSFTVQYVVHEMRIHTYIYKLTLNVVDVKSTAVST